MPELPEVQVMVNALNTLKDKRIISVHSVGGPHSLLKNTTEEQLQLFLEGGLVCSSVRYGKWICLHLHKSLFYKLFIHNSMHGRIRIISLKDEGPYEEHKHDRLIITVGDNRVDASHLLIYRDMRCWGQIHFYSEFEQPKFITKLGIDALSSFLSWGNCEELYAKHKKKSIGDVLLLQECIAGIGNIYRSEILYTAGISPFRFVNDLSSDDWRKIAEAITSILTAALDYGGSSISDFENPYGKPGGAQYLHNVYGHQGDPCRRCGKTWIKVELMTKRKIYFCPECQK